MGQNSKTKLGQNSNLNVDETQKLKLWHCCDSSDSSESSGRSDSTDSSDIFLSLKLWQNSKTQIVTKLKNYNCDKTQKL